MALALNKELKIEYFSASPYWILKFKRANRLVSRRITRVVSRRLLTSEAVVNENAEKFINEIRALKFPPNATRRKIRSRVRSGVYG